MTARTELENRVAREQAKLAELKNQVEREESFIEGLQEALKLLPRDAPNIRHGAGRRSRSESDVQKTKELLSTTTKPLHISDILKRIGKEDTKQNRASLASSLARYARKGEVFQREGPNEFSLIKETGNEIEDSRLPTLFGTE